MSKKVLSVALAIAMVAVMVCVGMFAASAAEEVKAGDQVKYIFYIGEVSNVGGLSVDSTYNSEYLKINGEPQHLITDDALGACNDLVEGQVRWNDTYATGKDFNNTDVFVITFDVLKDGTVDDLGLSFVCTEFFDTDALDIEGGPDAYVFARVEVVDNTVSSDVVSSDVVSSDVVSSDVVSSDVVSSDTVSSDTVSSDTVSSDTVSSDTVSSDTVSSDTVSSDTVSTTTSSDSSSKTESKGTDDNASKNSSATSSRANSSTRTNSTATGPVSTVQTAGTVAVASLVVVLMLAAGVVVFAKKRSELE